MATEILASGTTQASSSDFTLADGASANLIMRGSAVIQIEIAASTGYVTIGFLDNQYPVKTVSGPGTFRVTRQASGTAAAVDKE